MSTARTRAAYGVSGLVGIAAILALAWWLGMERTELFAPRPLVLLHVRDVLGVVDRYELATGTGLVGERHRSLPGEPSRVRRFGSNVVASIVEPPTTCVWRIADLELVACTPAPSAANEVLYDDARYFERGTPEPWIRAIDPATGHELWRGETSGESYAVEIPVSEDHVDYVFFFVDDTGRIDRADATGLVRVTPEGASGIVDLDGPVYVDADGALWVGWARAEPVRIALAGTVRLDGTMRCGDRRDRVIVVRSDGTAPPDTRSDEIDTMPLGRNVGVVLDRETEAVSSAHVLEDGWRNDRGAFANCSGWVEYLPWDDAAPP